MNIYKETKIIELDTSVFEYGALYTISRNTNSKNGYKLLVCCSELDSRYVSFVVVDWITGSYTYKDIRLDIEDDPDPTLEIYRVCLDRDSCDQRVYLREEKTDYRALAEKLYNVLERGAEDSCALD